MVLTDYLCGRAAAGVTSPQMLAESAVQPDYVIDSFGKLLNADN